MALSTTSVWLLAPGHLLSRSASRRHPFSSRSARFRVGSWSLWSRCGGGSTLSGCGSQTWGSSRRHGSWRPSSRRPLLGDSLFDDSLWATPPLATSTLCSVLPAGRRWLLDLPCLSRRRLSAVLGLVLATVPLLDNPTVNRTRRTASCVVGPSTLGLATSATPLLTTSTTPLVPPARLAHLLVSPFHCYVVPHFLFRGSVAFSLGRAGQSTRPSRRTLFVGPRDQ